MPGKLGRPKSETMITISLRIPVEYWEKFRKLAQKDLRSSANMVAYLMKMYIDENEDE